MSGVSGGCQKRKISHTGELYPLADRLTRKTYILKDIFSSNGLSISLDLGVSGVSRRLS
jgi:hypothetical protein